MNAMKRMLKGKNDRQGEGDDGMDQSMEAEGMDWAPYSDFPTQTCFGLC